MSSRIRIKQFAAVAVVAAGATGLVAEQGQAAPSQNHPTLKRGVLQVKGTAASEKIALRLKAGEPGTLQIDFGDDGQADFRVALEHVKRIDVDARAATTSCGSTTPTAPSPTASRRRSTAKAETTTSPEAPERSCCSAVTGTTRSTATGVTTWPSWAPATTPSSGIRATAATPSWAGPEPTRCCSTAPAPPSGSTCPRTGTTSGSSATSATSPWTPSASSGSTSTPSAAPTS